MDGTGLVEAIHLAPESGAETEPVESAEALAGEGLRGDRHFGATLTGLARLLAGRRPAVART